MPIGLTDDQRLLLESAERFFSRAYDFNARQKIVEHDPGFLPGHWKETTELGWLAAPFPEELGGLGLGIFDMALVMQAIGRHLFVSPYFSSVQLAARLAARRCDRDRASDLIAPVLAGRGHLALAFAEPRSRFDLCVVDTTATRTPAGFVLSGKKRLVLWAEVADKILVTARTGGARKETAGISLFEVEKTAEGVSERRYRTVDGHRASDMQFDNVQLPPEALLGELDSAYDDLEATCDEAAVLVAAEAVGCMAALHDMTLDYVKQREQFGRPIGKFQVVQHRMVDINIEHETSEAITFAAADHFDRGVDPAQRGRLASSAKAQTGWSGKFVGEEAVQLHGAIAMTNDLPIGHYMKRLTAIGMMFGDSAYHVRRFQALDDLTAIVEERPR